MRRIIRIDDNKRRMHGYLAHATLNGQTHKVYCSDIVYAGPDKALAAAQLAVARSLSEHDLYLALRRRHHRRQNTPGDIPGVNRVPRRATSGVFNYWVAIWTDMGGKRHWKKFSIARYTEQGAYEHALEARLAATIEERDMLRTLSERSEYFQLIAPEKISDS